LRSEPSGRTNLTLPGKSVRVRPAQLAHHSRHSGSHLSWVWVASSRHDLHGQRVGRKHDWDSGADILGIRVENISHSLCESLRGREVQRRDQQALATVPSMTA
jgi:hypothetical protein